MPIHYHNITLCTNDSYPEFFKLFSLTLLLIPYTLTIFHILFIIISPTFFTIFTTIFFYIFFILCKLIEMNEMVERPHKQCNNFFISDYCFPEMNIIYLTSYVIIFGYYCYFFKYHHVKKPRPRKKMKAEYCPPFIKNIHYYFNVTILFIIVMAIPYIYYESGLTHIGASIASRAIAVVFMSVLCLTTDNFFYPMYLILKKNLMKKKKFNTLL